MNPSIKELAERLPPIGATKADPDLLVQYKFVEQGMAWTYYTVEFDPKGEWFWGITSQRQLEMSTALPHGKCNLAESLASRIMSPNVNEHFERRDKREVIDEFSSQA